MPSVRVANRSNILIGAFVGLVALVAAGGAATLGGVLGAVLVAVCLGVFVLALFRGARMAVLADIHGITVRNFGRDYRVPWSAVATVDSAPSDNVTRAVTTLYIRKTDGSTIVGRGASAYSKSRVERWRELILATRPSA